jgi:predicted RNA-binding protein with PIN domain
MQYLIDGYNLLHAMGVMPARAGPGGLARARRCLLGLLHGVYEAESHRVTVVFDAAGAPPGASGEETFKGIHVCYARHQLEADDLIEQQIRHEGAPRQLTVVSDDHRLQTAARRRNCVALGCMEYLDELDRLRRLRRPKAEAPPEKATRLSAEEMRQWLAEFADLENDPAWRAFAEIYDFGED